MFGKPKQAIEGKSPPEFESLPGIPQVVWVPPEKNQWNIPILDLRPITQVMVAVSTNPKSAVNAISYGGDDGSGFAKDQPDIRRTITADLSYRIDRLLPPGVLFTPRVMEQRWAVFYHEGRILFIRSWSRKLAVAAQVQCADGLARITSVQGTFTDNNEEEGLTVRLLDYVIRSHALGLVFPTPLPSDVEKTPQQLAMWCMSLFGSMALFATPRRLDPGTPEKPLRTHTLLHLAVANGDLAAVDRHLRSGLPIDLLAGDGMAPLHWALVRENTAMAEFLIQHGSPVDVRSALGATPLMVAVRQKDVEKINLLLTCGADVNAADLRGITSLHLAADAGNLEVVRLLLDRGAHRDVTGLGETPASFAEKRGHMEVLKLLKLESL